MSIITEQDRNNIYEDYQAAIQQILDDPSTPAELKASVSKYGNAGQAPAYLRRNSGVAGPAPTAIAAPPGQDLYLPDARTSPAPGNQDYQDLRTARGPLETQDEFDARTFANNAAGGAGMPPLPYQPPAAPAPAATQPPRNIPQSTTLNPKSGLGFLTNQSNPQSAPAAAPAPAARVSRDQRDQARNNPYAGGRQGKPAPANPNVDRITSNAAAELGLTSPSNRMNPPGSNVVGPPPFKGGTIVGPQGMQSALAPGQSYDPSRYEGLYNFGDVMAKPPAPAPAKASNNPANQFVMSRQRPAASPPNIPPGLTGGSGRFGYQPAGAPAAPAATAGNYIPVTPEVFKQQTSTKYNQKSAADQSVMAAGNQLNQALPGLDPNKAFHTAYDAGIRKAFGLGSGGTNVSKAMTVFSNFLNSLNQTDPQKAKQIANMKINSSTVSKMVKDWAASQGYNVNQPTIQASFEYKGDSQLLWEAYQDITRY
jgi:hypothetical protein